MKIVLVSKCSLDIEQYAEFKMSVLMSPSKSLISSRWVTYIHHFLKFLADGNLCLGVPMTSPWTHTSKID